MPILQFLGAARTVTGSKHLLDTGTAKVLVDCGLFQGLKELRERNWNDLPVRPADITAVVLTHAHLDHCGYLPRLVAQGFRGRIFCTPGTQDLCRIVLPDAGRIQEEDAENANRHSYTKHAPALPLYTEADAFRAISQLQPVGYDRPMPVADGVEAEFINAGHLLGSSYARVRVAGKTILFGGDLGRFGRPVLPDPTMIAEADYLLVESTYGNRVHEQDDNGERLAAGHPCDRRARRQGRHPRVCRRARRGTSLLGQAARGGTPNSRASGVRRQPDGDRSPRQVHRARAGARSGAAAGRDRRQGAARQGGALRFPQPTPAARAARTSALRVLHRALPDDRVAAGEQGADGVEDAGHRHLVERHGNWRPRPPSPEGRASRSAEHRAPRWLPGGRDARALCWPMARRRSRFTGRTFPSTPTSRRSIRCRRTPTRRRSFAGSAASRALRDTTFLVHGEPVAMEALQASIKAQARLEHEDAAAPARVVELA